MTDQPDGPRSAGQMAWRIMNEIQTWPVYERRNADFFVALTVMQFDLARRQFSDEEVSALLREAKQIYQTQLAALEAREEGKERAS